MGPTVLSRRPMGLGFPAFLTAIVLASCSAPEFPAALAPGAAPCSVAETGRLDTSLIHEASGLAVSRRYGGRLYHVNDSGDSGRFFQTAMDGSGTRPVVIDGFTPADTEDLALGPCGLVDGDCLYVADIGDNNRRRDEVRIVVLEELEEFPGSVAPLATISVRYPDGPQDAESLVLHPNGDLFIVTKFADYSLLEVFPSHVYRLALDTRLRAGDDVVVLERVGDDLEFATISSDTFSGSLPTAADISADGLRLLILTYVNAFEFFVDLAQGPLKPAQDMIEGVDYREIPLRVQAQQEAVAYAGENTFLYTTERASEQDAPILEVRCDRQTGRAFLPG
jgi:hypothetical protein